MKTLHSLPWLLLPLYFIPIVRLLLSPLQKFSVSQQRGKSWTKFGLSLGRWEYLCGPLRDFLLNPLFFFIFIFSVFRGRQINTGTLVAAALFIFFIFLTLLSMKQRQAALLKSAECARKQAQIHPQDFFNFYYQSLSPWSSKLKEFELRQLPFHEADFRSNEKIRWTYSPLLKTIVSTSTLARMAMTAFRKMPAAEGLDAFDGLARVWGSRIAQIFQSKLSVHGTEVIPPLEGKTLLLFNHQSYLDFALNFFALASLKKSDGRSLRPRFIAAKDHFIDNPLLYSWIGVGKTIENAGMIFINRQKKGQGWAAMKEAAEKLSELDVEIAVYPQGTRAKPMLTAMGERNDAGYYTTFNPKNWASPLGHLKPGTAHLILDTLIRLKQKGEKQLNILAIGISGAATAAPRNNMKVQTQSEIGFHLAPPWILPTSLADGITSPSGQEPKTIEERLYMQRITELQTEINRNLLKALDWHTKLKAKARLELTRMSFTPDELQRLSQYLEKADRAQEAFPFILLDRIFSLEPRLWERFLRLFFSLLGEEIPKSAGLALLQEVSERL